MTTEAGIKQQMLTKGSVQATPFSPFSMIAADMMDSMPIAGVVDYADSRQACRQLVSLYEQSLSQLEKRRSDLQNIIKGTAAAHSFYTDLKDKPHADEHERNLAFWHRVPELSVPDVMRAQTMTHEPPKIHRLFRNAINTGAVNLSRSFYQCLHTMRKEEIVGSIQWSNPRTCVYNFFRSFHYMSKGHFVETKSTKRVIEQVGTPGSPRSTRWRDIEVTDTHLHQNLIHKLERHEHQLFNAARHQMPAPQVKKPHWFAPSFGCQVAPWLSPHLWVVEGDMIRESIDTSTKIVRTYKTHFGTAERVIREGFLYSPAVTIGDFVLLGWSGKDL
jgi:hypothetical protein